MARGVGLGLVGFLLLCATGCGGPDSLIKSMISDMHALADSIERGEPKERQQAIANRMKKTIEKLHNLKLTPEEEDRLEKKYEVEIERAERRLMDAIQKASEKGDPPDLDGIFP